jgi:hypothetical protein
MEDLKILIKSINDYWLAKEYDKIGVFLSDDVVIRLPGGNDPIRGNDAYIQSYRDYDQMAKTHAFSAEEPVIDLMGDVAVATCPFSVVYEIEGQVYREKGHEHLVFSRSGKQWLIVWRTMVTTPIED